MVGLVFDRSSDCRSDIAVACPILDEFLEPRFLRRIEREGLGGIMV